MSRRGEESKATVEVTGEGGTMGEEQQKRREVNQGKR